MMQEADFSKYTVDIRCNPTPPIGLTYLDVALKMPMPALLRISETSVKERHQNFKREPNIIYTKGALLGRDRKSRLVRLLSRKWAEFDGVAGFCKANFDPDIAYAWTRGAVVLNISGVRPEDRGRKVFALDFNSFTLDESAGGWHIGYVKYSQQYGRACVVFRGINEEPIATNDLRLIGFADVRI